MLQELAPPELAAAARAALDAAEEKVDEADFFRACARAEGSVREALRLLSGADADFDALVEGTLSQLPEVDWRNAHRIADRVVGRERETEYDAFLQAVFAWLAAALRRQEAGGPRALAPYAMAWENLEREARDLEIFNLDKRAFTLIVFSQLGEAESAARAALNPM